MKKYILTTLALALLLPLSGCKTDFNEDVSSIKPTAGSADFSNYIALGNSLTSGFSNNALYIDGQKESYPNIIAGQMQKAGGGEFIQPMMADNNGGLLLNGIPIQGTKLVLTGFTNGNPDISNAQAAPTTDITNKVTGKLNNFGVPGAKSFHLLAPGYGNIAGVLTGKANPYYVRFATSATSTVVGDAALQKPTFYSLWIGNNDVLGYATSGGTGTDQTGNLNPATYGPNDITDPQFLAKSIEGIIQTMAAAGATKGVIANIPNVTSIPFFTTVPYAPLDPRNPAFGPLIPALNQQFGLLNQAFVALGHPERQITFSTSGPSALVIMDKDLPNISTQLMAVLQPKVGLLEALLLSNLYGQARQATPQDLVLLTASSMIGQVNTAVVNQMVAQSGGLITQQQAAQLAVNGVTLPMEDQYVLTTTEQGHVAKAVSAYNSAIAGLATKYHLAFMNANAKMVNLGLPTGIEYNAVTYHANFITGGAFSLDGVHLTGRGYAVIANEFIKSINQTYGSTIPLVNPNDYSGIDFPK